MDQLSKTKEQLEIYKGLAQCNFKEPENGNVGLLLVTVLKRYWAIYKLEINNNNCIKKLL